MRKARRALARAPSEFPMRSRPASSGAGTSLRMPTDQTRSPTRMVSTAWPSGAARWVRTASLFSAET